MPRPPRQAPVPPLTLPSRPRRNRANEVLRAFARETSLTVDRLIYPLFITGGEGNSPIASMPGCQRLGWAGMLEEIHEALKDGLKTFILFPVIDNRLKDPRALEAANATGLIPNAIRRIKHRWPEAVLVTDVALDPYNSDGHDGLVDERGVILNDETIDKLCQQALTQAEAGADIVAPSDMMDGRVGAIRRALDEQGFSRVAIMSYTAKYASAFYGPFRDALDSAPKAGDKKTYQMDPANRREALRELALDEAEGADIVMVKPAGPYLDVIRELREATVLPVAAYQVSGEYAMLKAAAENGWLDEKRAVLESLLAIRRAGADVILTYFARQVARWLADDNRPPVQETYVPAMPMWTD